MEVGINRVKNLMAGVRSGEGKAEIQLFLELARAGGSGSGGSWFQEAGAAYGERLQRSGGENRRRSCREAPIPAFLIESHNTAASERCSPLS